MAFVTAIAITGVAVLMSSNSDASSPAMQVSETSACEAVKLPGSGTTRKVELSKTSRASANGSKIVFGSSRFGGNHDIYVMDTNGSNQTRLTTNAAYDDQPKWSPDGSKIVFMSNRDGNFEIYSMNADGSNQTRLTNNPAADGFPAWSPDGSKIAFVNGDLRAPESFEIFVMNADGNNRIRLTNDSLIDGVPAWSPDGTKIVFMSGAGSVFNPNAFEIFVMNADGTNRTQLTSNSVADGQPSYSPDGSKILFASGDAMNPNGVEIFVMNANGSNRTQLTTNSITDGFPSWSPDGSKIVFAGGSVGDETTVEIFTMDATGGNRTQLTTNSSLDWFADWQPGPVPVNGKVTDISGVGIIGVTLTITGAPNGFTVSTVTDANGNYSLNNTFGGDTLTPTKSGYVFDPESVRAVSSGGPVPITGTFNFIGGTAVYTLSGRVIDGTGAGLSNILITVTGSQQRVELTDAGGNYAIHGLFAGGNFTIKPSQNGFVFNPVQVGFTNLPAGDRTVPTFVGTMHPYTITGQVKDNLNNSLSAVLLSLRRVGGTDGVAASTNAGGNYTLTNVASEATYTLTPSKAGYSFSPTSVTFTTPTGNQTANFTGTPLPAVQFSLSNYDVNEGDVFVTVTVNRSGDTTLPSTVDFASSNGTAIQTRDYEVANGTLTFAAGDTSRTFRVLIVNDVYAEGSETVNLTLSSPAGAVLGAQTSSTVTIADNDSAGTTSPAARQFVSNLVGADEVPATPNTVKGNGGIFQLSNDELSGKVSLLFSGLTGAETGAHVHAGAPGVNGPIIFPLPLGNPINDFIVNPTPQQVIDLRAGQQYMNVHSEGFQGGEIRGQLLWNPAEEADFFVRQAYFDFLSRVPDANGFAFWVDQITQCQSDVECLRRKRVDVSNAFFYEQEFQQTAGYVLRLYRGAYGNNQPFPNPNPNAGFPNEEKKLPSYAVFVADRARVIGGANLAQKQLDLANLFVTRPEFVTRYPGSLATADQFVDALLLTLQNDLGVNLSSQRANLINVYNTQGGRGATLYRLADENVTNPIANQPFINAEYNRSFVLGQYFGYLRRNPDIPGFMFWLGQVNGAPLRDVPRQHAMVCSFITSGEFQFRFGPTASRNNNECGQ
ncbi:MAG: exported protein of unknown function [Acidobacteria bacterium]|nr:exported protein of unknown function [Acidobacteriota bacterium]